MKGNDFFPDVTIFYQDAGREALMGFLWKLQHQICDTLGEQNEGELLK